MNKHNRPNKTANTTSLNETLHLVPNRGRTGSDINCQQENHSKNLLCCSSSGALLLPADSRKGCGKYFTGKNINGYAFGDFCGKYDRLCPDCQHKYAPTGMVDAMREKEQSRSGVVAINKPVNTLNKQSADKTGQTSVNAVPSNLPETICPLGKTAPDFVNIPNNQILKDTAEYNYKFGYADGLKSAQLDEIKFLESLELDDMDELTMQVDGKDVYLDTYLRKRISELKGALE